ncbi:hypothetical protein ABMA70_09465 [Halobacteriovorax sp. XZX-3]|uniref:hypothetical protein n=1 Tax=unclassified Halobacteriovorax TaxID=2639665 RepID=UPI00372294B3
MRLFLFLALLFSTLNLQAKNTKLLDKITAVVDEHVITKSMIERVKKSLPIRQNISPFIYKKEMKYTDKEVADLIIRKFIIRSTLAEQGYVISDATVEKEIKRKEQRLGLSRNDLIAFLKKSNTNFEEFFELNKEAIEFNHFNSVVIIPLISVSEQEIKNEFFKENVNNKTVSYRYTLVDFSIDESIVTKKDYAIFKKTMESFQKGGPLPSKYGSIETSTLGDITADGLTADLQKLLNKTQEGQFTQPINMMGETHIFYVKTRDVVESSLFQNAKNRIRALLYESKAKEVTQMWFEREKANHYVKTL